MQIYLQTDFMSCILNLVNYLQGKRTAQNYKGMLE